ncbi:MAG: hypothetical protein AMJ95_11565 [Omnitrophica WOR_2 bacterium SM23_72]|nr:MAG: hypothetical protein AMJ95_11565 [Omnitrophica WOR_2 bacterium SM23_72]
MKERTKRSGRFFVYIIECKDGTYYTGYTNNLKTRLIRHNKGFASKYTRPKLPVRLVWKKGFLYFRSAFMMERRIKKLTRKQKEELVRGKRLDKVLTDARK